MRSFKIGDTVYIIVSNTYVSPCKVTEVDGEFYTVTFSNGGAIRLRRSRLFSTEEEATAKIPKQVRKSMIRSNSHGYTPWDD